MSNLSFFAKIVPTKIKFRKPVAVVRNEIFFANNIVLLNQEKIFLAQQENKDCPIF